MKNYVLLLLVVILPAIGCGPSSKTSSERQTFESITKRQGTLHLGHLAKYSIDKKLLQPQVHRIVVANLVAGSSLRVVMANCRNGKLDIITDLDNVSGVVELPIKRDEFDNKIVLLLIAESLMTEYRLELLEKNSVVYSQNSKRSPAPPAV